MNIIDFLKNKFKNINSQQKQLFQDYDDLQPRYNFEILEGYRHKEFKRANSIIFADLIEELQKNPNCSYVTYINDLIKDSGITPSYISVLKKEFEEDDKFNFIDNEVISSRVANAMGVPTVYNMKYDNNLLSVDFLKFGSTIINIEDRLQDFSETIDLISYDSNFVNQILSIEQIISFHNQQFKNNKWNYCGNFREDYLLYYLTRNYILGDADDYPRNVCLIVDRDNNLCLGPMFDTEQSFSNTKFIQSKIYDLLYAIEYLPKTLQKFNDRFAKLFEKETFDSLFKGCTKKVAQEKMNYIKNSYIYYIANYEKAKKLKDLEHEEY